MFFRDCFKYQNHIDTDLTAEQSWKVIEWKTGTQDYPIDNECLEFVKKIIRDKCKNAQIKLITEHDEILKIIKETGHKHNFVVNIDNHHDVTYFNDDEKLDIENWVKHGRNEDLIGGYIWLHQDSSETCLNSPFHFLHSSWKDFKIENLKDFDLVVLCLSPYFTPPKYWELINFLNVYNNLKNHNYKKETE